MTIKRWFLSFLTDTPATQILNTGSRVKTKHGMGTVVGGCLHVKLDKPRTIHVNDRTWTYNLQDKIEVVYHESHEISGGIE